jgi:hypothetical protein
MLEIAIAMVASLQFVGLPVRTWMHGWLPKVGHWPIAIIQPITCPRKGKLQRRNVVFGGVNLFLPGIGVTITHVPFPLVYLRVRQPQERHQIAPKTAAPQRSNAISRATLVKMASAFIMSPAANFIVGR